MALIKAGIIGCGNISDIHAEVLQNLPYCKIVGVCDKEKLMAKQLYERYDIENYMDNIDELLEQYSPDVVHITTPPQSHFEIAKKCLEAGCHVYIEKPFTLNTEEAQKLLNLASINKRKVTVGHDRQFSHAERRMRKIIKNGYLGGLPRHMESYYYYNLTDQRYAMALLGNKNHWVRDLPGKLLHNIISHGIARLSEYFLDDDVTVRAYGFTSAFLKKIGEEDIIDELRVIVSDSKERTAYFTFSSQMRPTLNLFRLFGKKNGLIIDHNQQTIIKVSGNKYKSYLETFIPPVIYAKQYIGNTIFNIKQFLKNDFHLKSGIVFLIETFYRSILENAPLPISYREILLTSKIMDDIFEQIKN